MVINYPWVMGYYTKYHFIMKRIIYNISIIFLLTTATIIFEISLSRLFSYMLSYHFVLIIIAFSILGLGIGQMIYSKYLKSIKKSITQWYAYLPTSMLVSFLLLLVIPRIELFSTTNLSLLAFIVLSILPFIFIGIIYAQIFEVGKKQVSLLYGIDLIGASTGALLSVFLLNTFNLGSVIIIAVLLLFSAFMIHAISRKHAYSIVFLLSFILILQLIWIGNQKLNFNITIANDPSKDMLRLMSNPAIESEIVETQWNSFGKTDLVNLGFPNGANKKVMFIDGAAGTDVINIDELIQDSVKMIQKLSGFPALFNMNFLASNEKDTALIIGPGGGIDIAAAWFAGFNYVEGVEVNPSFVRLMEIYNPSTFIDKDNIKIHVNEGRNFVRNRKGRYDAIFLTIPVTKSTRGADFYGLTENYLFTVEALDDYLEGLTEEGTIFFTMHGKQEVYRMLSNYLELQQNKGINAEEAFKQVYIVSNGMNPVLTIKKRPFESKQIEQVHLAAHRFSLDEDVFFFPYISQVGTDTLIRDNINFSWFMFDDLLHGISKGKYSKNKLWEASLLNLRPVFDDAPYFFNYNKGIPESMTIPLWLSIGILGWFLFKLLTGWNLSINTIDENNVFELNKKFKILTVIVFLLGFAYFFIQAYMFQILNLKLSNPSQSFSLLLFTFLLGNGLGSLLTYRFKTALPQKLMIYTSSVIGVSILTALFLIPLLDTRLSEIGIAIVLFLPSFFIGIPFPILLKIAAKIEYKNTLPILLGISSIAGVSASIFAVILSILYGYKVVFLIGLVAYTLVILGAYRLKSIEGKIKLKTKSQTYEMVS